ncbi:hypothetical protein ACFSKU_20875 [Pontibacter silvestris]|uniref:Uncharacterized protein n=1 Tax=Pontibacter silvestris TaxID=2305183 RepID=A0ABW4X4S6_9BACT|nr:hypothetical protein [Pontibacter silvestris]MCC9137157.1 hypothetical protein [Pontibacter silvestris]
MRMNIYIVIGILIIAIGTFIMYVGSGKSSDKSQKEILEKFEETQHKIDALKSSPNTNSKEIAKIEDEFNEWANDFIKTKDLKKLDLEKKGLDVKSNRIVLSSKWKPQLDSFFSSLKSMIDVYRV